ncbi:flagellar motor protein MotB [Roseateles sp.]|uniref:flagellar motor protein MotB n=1 Tax=Roseateles sp. TaxID=1971397 RepID=UPI0025D6150E|nr:flagellar motor protein MotB [Roseateles sp.]MBV8036773.1 OmpA family protein [Roseateles sp.]
MQPNGKPGRADGQHPTVVKRVSRKSHDDGHGGAWKVAFADFCLALLCLFLVMWLLASRNSERMQVVLKSAGANLLDEGNGMTNSLASGSRGSMIERHPVPAYGEAPAQGQSHYSQKTIDSPGPAAPGSRASYERPAELAALARVIERVSADEGLGGNLRMAVTPQGLRVMLHDTDSSGMFERGSAAPSPRFKALLQKLGPVFAQMRNQLLIVGHTDASQYVDRGPSAFSNWALSTHRAMSARLHLLEGGMPESSVMQVSGMADSAPLDPDDRYAAVNRRIELMILTPRQTQQLSQMFGAPAQSVPLAPSAAGGQGMAALSAESAEAARELRRALPAEKE